MANHTAWIILVVAGLCEVGFTTCMKLSNNFTEWRFTAGFALFMATSLYLLNKACQTLPLGTAYAVWTGVGALGTALIGIIWFQEPAGLLRSLFLLLLIASLVGLKLVD